MSDDGASRSELMTHAEAHAIVECRFAATIGTERVALSALTETQGFIVLEEHCEAIRPGDIVEFMPLRSILA